ncbi:uncharacterized protein BO95DRAFT_506721 [Aspergillus brunneoviolaceus CBS 621.78]|uniref:Uncharacterized protein n=1 Tax=Aspergillus brunneoviolaceus CBS 621.78 TaxID=1450534 RepID=A0ACD1GK24_9EURO|nr:hypothetical protein BO95DRAFT_506721 [Aspergillus brunneoviolaceus CBS 621.78]RAH49616.1 hypothetical protein BO95DRAFT_506721 [Aspergillus brunneoviolaceus CBS 621.78]
MVEPIAVIGYGFRFPGGADTPSKLWSLLRDPTDLSSKPPASRFDVDLFYHPVGTHHGTTNAPKSYWLAESEGSSAGSSPVAQFDAGFFNIQAAEADAMDPQQRLLMEAVYDGLCAAGQPMEDLRGSDTAVYVGLMSDDWSTMLTRDWETLPRYTATGLERGIVANRLSYFFGWHGPSMTIDTACSSSLVALDLAVQALRSGKSKVAVAAGTNLILSPAMYISESNLGMLSPNGRCAMWDVAADGYARGEGVAAVLVKTLSQALADNDPIQCIIRETAVNQDGRTAGLTVPSNIAQAALIRECYARAGLDPIRNINDRPQFFHAHGTGTQAGDPQEAEAISNALFPTGVVSTEEKLVVGSIKTVIGHTEGTAGLASLIGTALALKNHTMPPNLHFEDLSPKVAPYFKHLEILTAQKPWIVAEGQVRRASVNSFGFGGTNAHCILEEYIAPDRTEGSEGDSQLYTPLVFSAAAEKPLREMLAQHLEFLKTNPEISLADVAYTLQVRRSTLPYRKAVSATTLDDAISALEELVSSTDTALSPRFSSPAAPRILGIFTGQGAQWPRMGARLLETSRFATERLALLDRALQSLPDPADRPAWTLADQLLASAETSRIAEAALSQPLCTAVQILLVDILRAAGITFAAVVGHSSGEIGAAYAAGLLSDVDAIRIAYYRGVHAKRAASPNLHAPRGGMMAVGADKETAQALCSTPQFYGRLQLAAVNSPSSVTLSGDVDAVEEAEALLKAQGTFARKLKVDTAYHSAHMAACAGPYLASLDGCGVQATATPNSSTVWYSSVFEGQPMNSTNLTNQYWVDNMCKAVLFAGALSEAQDATGQFDLAIEVGPHPALKGPATATIATTPYTGLLARGQDDVVQLNTALGAVWTQLGTGNTKLAAVESLLSGSGRSPVVIDDLPSYPFDHSKAHWTDSRVANHFKHRQPTHKPNPLLGTPITEALTPGEVQWRNFLQPRDLPWLNGHQLQGQTVFPAMGYVSMAVEALSRLAQESTGGDSTLGVISVRDVQIPRAVTLDDDDSSVEVIFSLSAIERSATNVTARWACYSVTNGSTLVLNAQGRVEGELCAQAADTLDSGAAKNTYQLVPITEEHFYANLSRVGYGYSGHFRGLSDICRKPGYSTGTLTDHAGSGWEDDLLVHPGTLDSALQSIFAAWSYPGDTQLWSLHVPVSIGAVTINPYFTQAGAGGRPERLEFEASITKKEPTQIVGELTLRHNVEGSVPAVVVQVEGATLVPFSPATSRDDLPMFSQFQYGLATPDGLLAAEGETLTDVEVQMYQDVDRISYWYLREAAAAIPATERDGLLPHYQKYLGWCDRMVEMVSRGAHPKVSASRNEDTREQIAELCARYADRKDFRFVEVVGENLVPVLRAGTSMLEHMNQDGLLRAFYAEDAICSGPTGRWLSRIVAQISHRFPGVHILEVGAGTGATTSAVLDAVQGSYGSYTFTDISSGFFLAAEDRFGPDAARMRYQTFDMERSPSTQGFEEETYDVIVAVNVLHVSGDIQASLSNVRRLLRPGGFLVVAELTSTDLLFSGMTVGTLPGWWIGADTGRPWGPLFTLSQWDAALQASGFGGIDTVSPDISASLPMTVFVAQAVDDRVALLRNPLSVAVHPEGIRTDALAIVGGTTWPVHKLGRDVAQVLGPRFGRTEFFPTLSDLARSDLTPSKFSVPGSLTILVLTDLDRPYLDDVTQDKLSALQTCTSTAGTFLWVTAGARDQTPASYMMLGIFRTIQNEHPDLNSQLFDLETGIQAGTANILAEALLRQQALYSWKASEPDASLLWTMEPEVYSSSTGKLYITRLRADQAKNNRYNALRRSIKATVSPATERLALVSVEDGDAEALALQVPSPLRWSPPLDEPARSLRITHSLLQSVAACTGDFVRPCIGKDIDTQETVFALAASNESVVTVPRSQCVLVEENAHGEPALASRLVSLAAQLIAQRILSIALPGSTGLIHSADATLQAALTAQAEARNVALVFTDTATDSQDTSTIHLDPRLSQSAVKSLLPKAPGFAVLFSNGKAMHQTILQHLPASCLVLNEQTLISHAVTESELNASSSIAQQFQTAYKAASCSTAASLPPLIALDKVQDHSVLGEALSVIDWTASSTVTATVQPITSGRLFRPDRTYLFIGMAGELGQSLAGWLIAHGARYVVLTSRTPKVSPQFIQEMATQYQAVVRAVSLDITSQHSLLSVHAALTATLPPIAGVINGAMILSDELFARMSYEQFTRVLAPKVRGTQLLDELFRSPDLDFFVVASSIAAVIGWTGQSNYSAANEYMISLMHQRRRKHGLPGSAMSIPAVLGVGYAAHSDTFDFDYFASLGYINISEEDLQVLFAEAILSGRPAVNEEEDRLAASAQVVTGVNTRVPSEEELVPEGRRRDVKFSHLVRRDEGSVGPGGGDAGAAASEPIKVRLQRVLESPAEASVMVKEAFVAHLKRLLRIPAAEAVDEAVPLVDRGVDSLVAVDIRAWFTKELQADIPTLKILNGGSVGDLVRDAVEQVAVRAKKVEEKVEEKVVVKVEVKVEEEVKDEEEEEESVTKTSPLPTLTANSSSGSPLSTPAASDLESVEYLAGAKEDLGFRVKERILEVSLDA